MTILKTTNLSKYFQPDKSAVHQINLAVENGEIICLLGPSGCGKTTLLRLIAGLEQADEGAVIFENQELTHIPPHQRDFGMMFQDFALFPHKNVFDNIAFGLQMRGDKPSTIQNRVTEMLDLVDLNDFEKRDINQLSGGEQQRIALARSLAPGPRLLMLDEPLGALDRALRERLMLDLRTILKKVDLTAIYVTHDQTEAFAIADRIAVMNQGRIEQIATPQTLFNNPATPFVARFLGHHNLLSGKVISNTSIKTDIGPLHLPSPLPPINTQVTILIKADAINLTSKNNQQQIQAIITAISFRGRYYQVWVNIQNTSLMFETPTLNNWQIGDKIKLALNNEEIICFDYLA